MPFEANSKTSPAQARGDVPGRKPNGTDGGAAATGRDQASACDGADGGALDWPRARDGTDGGAAAHFN